MHQLFYGGTTFELYLRRCVVIAIPMLHHRCTAVGDCVHFGMFKKETIMAKSLSTLSISDLRAELAKREKGLPKLIAKRKKLDSKLIVLDRQIAALGGEHSALPAKIRKQRVAKNAKPLMDDVIGLTMYN